MFRSSCLSQGDIFYYYTMIPGTSNMWSARGLSINITGYENFGTFVGVSALPNFTGTLTGTTKSMVFNFNDSSYNSKLIFLFSFRQIQW